MKLLRMVSILGPNIYHNRPVTVMTMDLEEEIETESSQLPEFVQSLLMLLPGLHKHRCSPGYEGGFVERLHRGTYFGHIIEHVALELSEPMGLSVGYGKTVYAGEPGLYKVIIESPLAPHSQFLLETALELVQALLAGQPFPLDEKLKEGRRIVERSALGPSTRAIVDAAEKKNIPWRRFDESSMIQFGYGKERKYIIATQGWNTRSIAVDTSCDKARTKKFLENACIPVPYGKLVRTEEEAAQALHDIGGAVAIKPFDGNQGKGVSLHITSSEAAKAAFHIAAAYSAKVIVEEMFKGDDYRLIVVDGKLVAAAKRLPPQIIGNGHATVEELLAMENADPRRGEGHEKPMTKIPFDAIAQACLQRQGYSLSSKPPAGQVINLRDNTNLSTGGRAVDVTDSVHPSIVRMACRAADAVGLDICGIDLLVEDITQPLRKQNGIVEVNAAPGIRMHHFPSEGVARDVGAAIVEMLYPNVQTGRIPIISITGTNGKTSTTRMIGHVLQRAGLRTGMTTSSGIWIDGDCIQTGDTTGPRSARTVLSEPSVDVAVLETARGGLTRHGLGYDWSDISIITNIQADHIGQDGIENEDDILNIKSLVAERVREGGTLILNACDQRLVNLPQTKRMQKLKRNIVLFAVDPHTRALQEHLSSGGTVYYVERNWLCEARSRFDTKRIVDVTELAVTMGGTARFQIENLLAAVAALRAQGQSVELIASALCDFENVKDNQGRLNLYKVNRGYVLLDYGHNTAAIEAVNQTVLALSPKVSCVLNLPGDRTDAIIEMAASMAARCFQRIRITEPRDLRGRRPGETANITLRAIRQVDLHKDCRIILNEGQALAEAIDSMEDDEIVVHFYDDLEAAMASLSNKGAQPMNILDVIAGKGERPQTEPLKAPTGQK